MPSDLPAPVSALIDAGNRGDTRAFLEAFTDDGVVDDWGREFAGAAAIRGWSDDEFIGKEVSLDVTSVVTAADETVVIAQVGGEGFNGPSTFSFSLTGAKVSRMTIRA